MHRPNGFWVCVGGWIQPSWFQVIKNERGESCIHPQIGLKPIRYPLMTTTPRYEAQCIGWVFIQVGIGEVQARRV